MPPVDLSDESEDFAFGGDLLGELAIAVWGNPTASLDVESAVDVDTDAGDVTSASNGAGADAGVTLGLACICLLYTSPSPPRPY